MVEASNEVRQEIERYKEVYTLMCDNKGMSVVCFERNFKTAHLQFQMIPIPKDTAKSLRSALLNEGWLLST